ncbi:MAG: hypothetical protein HQL30_03645 [Candidatus Omnitrophica bacterium]|nr:hypothetical protein [Candidatus Omnitrophota bacterium]
MPRIRYEIDPYNRLVLNSYGEKSDLPEFRQVLDGRFMVDGNNELTYRIKAPLPEGMEIPNQLRLTGDWALTDDHALSLTLDKSSRETFGDKITLEGDILDVKGNSLLFAVTTVTKKHTRSIYVLELGGSWKADDNNRITFHARKEGGRYDILTFMGAWDMNDDFQLVYRYEEKALIRKKSQTHTLVFAGRWVVKEKFRITYALSGDTDSVFSFKTGAGVFREGDIRYEAGIGLVSKADPVKRIITLSGKWYLKRDLGLAFEARYGDKRTGTIVFGADIRLLENNTVSFRLKNDPENRDIGIELKLSHNILKGDGQAFLSILASGAETTINAGVAWRW